MKRLVIVALVGMMMLTMLPMGVTATSAPAVVTVQNQIYGVATSNQQFVESFSQVGASEFSTTYTTATFPLTFANYTSLTYENFGVALSLQNSLIPMVNITQNGVTLLNNTGTGTFFFSVPNATAPINITTPAAFLPGGGTPAIGDYIVLEATQLVIEYQALEPSSWQQSGTKVSQSLNMTAPASYWLNQTTVWLPFPSPVAVQYQTVNVTVNGALYPYAQVTSNGIYLSIPSIAPGQSIVFTVTYTPAPTQTGVAPVFTISSYSSISGNGAPYVGTASWTNSKFPIWGGLYLIDFNIAYTLDSSSINISLNGHYLPSTSYLVSSDIITILPLVYLTPMGSTINLTVKFNLVAAPVQSHVTDSSGLNIGGIVITLGEGLLAIIVISLLVIIYMWLSPARGKFEQGERASATYGLIALLLACGFAYYLFR